MPLLQVQHIRCRYDDNEVISDLSFQLQPGQITCLLGPSGCGKTTVLRAIAGFEPVHAGSIGIDNNTLSEPGKMLAPESRQIGMVFQDYALFPHLTVAGNVGFALNKQSAEARERTVSELLTLVKLEDYRKSYPHQLSGGQQQRVALARALAPQPQLLLLDEPFSNLDTELRRSLSLEVRSILKARGISAILVTHDRTEAFNMADEIGVMEAGKLAQWANPETLYHHPANAFVANFICDGRFLKARRLSVTRLSSAFGELTPPDGIPEQVTQNCQILIRPWELVLRTADNSDAPTCTGTLMHKQFLGSLSLSTLALEDGTLLDSSDERLAGQQPGEKIALALITPQLLTFPA